MRIQKFIASDMRDAIVQIRNELGPEALIVATRQVRKGLVGTELEVTAAIDEQERKPAPRPSATPSEATSSHDIVERALAPLRSELRSLRSTVRGLLEERAMLNSMRSEVHTLRRTVEQLRAPSGRPAIEAMTDEYCVPSKGKIVALVGPTGVGKTTTIAKLAAHEALAEGRSIQLISLDTYRVGAEAQMRTFAELMGVPLTVVPDARDLRGVVDDLPPSHRVYIDTVGRSARDRNAITELEQALGGLSNLEVHLALAAGSSDTMIDAWAAHYRSVQVDRLLFTKVDEAVELSELVRAPARLDLPVSYITTGQRIPEDIERATPIRLSTLTTTGFSAEIAA